MKAEPLWVQTRVYDAESSLLCPQCDQPMTIFTVKPESRLFQLNTCLECRLVSAEEAVYGELPHDPVDLAGLSWDDPLVPLWVCRSIVIVILALIVFMDIKRPFFFGLRGFMTLNGAILYSVIYRLSE